MRAYSGYRGKQFDRELKANAPRAEEAFVQSLVREVDATRPSRGRSRRIYAVAFTAVAVGALTSFAGVGLAATGSGKAVKSGVTSETSAQGQYANQAPVRPAGTQESEAATTKPATASSTLPFTGFSLIGTLALGGALLGVGLLLRRRENRK
jgi:hypothetical protein